MFAITGSDNPNVALTQSGSGIVTPNSETLNGSRNMQ